MDSTTNSPMPLGHPIAVAPKPLSATELASLLGQAQEVQLAPGGKLSPNQREQRQNELVEVRLGIASSLFTALRSKHAPTASHSLRVALSCSAWARSVGLPENDCDEIEVAALLHDIGKIGVPDNVLLKPRALSSDEAAVMGRHRQMGTDILQGCCASQNLLATVVHAAAWYDGSRPGFDILGESLPVGARILAIADAYDAMTTDHVYRRAMSRERAVAELFRCAGTQFDPHIVRQFAELTEGDAAQFYPTAAQRWLEALAVDDQNSRWQLQISEPSAAKRMTSTVFDSQLRENMIDAVIFVDTNLKILEWNPAAERLTGISASSVRCRKWTPGLLKMQYEDGSSELDDEHCPVAQTLAVGTQMARRMTVAGRGDRFVPVDMHVVPVTDHSGTVHGATIVLHDASPEITLEERCQNLHERATTDPLTQVANRAEFDRVHELFVEVHSQRDLPCSLIICDIDRFKLVNDTWGHQAGDAVIRSIASVLRSHCRPGDLVARYGGEEFVVLCADCNNQTATQRAETMRRAFGDVSQKPLEGRHVTASFGVTEIQPGDTPETMLRRADRALLTAKDMGRNTVMQLGSGLCERGHDKKRRTWFGRRGTPDKVLEAVLLTPVPMKIAVEKLRGFLADQGAEISHIENDHVQLTISGDRSPFLQRRSDRVVPFVIDLDLSEYRQAANEAGDDASVNGKTHPDGTLLKVKISPRKSRDRRRDDVTLHARQMLLSLRSYLMATEVTDEAEGMLKKTSQAQGL